jgi:hypothetical protein
MLRPGAAHGYCVGLIPPASLAGAGVKPVSRAQHPCQFGAGETVVVTDYTLLQMGYGLPLSSTKLAH